MTTPSLAFNIRGRGRHYPFPPCDTSSWPRNRWGSINPEDVPEDVTPLPSVTTCLSVLDKGPGLMYWAAEQALRAAYDGGWPPTADEAVDKYRGAFRKARDGRAEAGTRAHTVAERLANDLPLPEGLSEEDEAYADAFLAFWSDYDPEPVGVEVSVAKPLKGGGYAGTADLFCRLNGTPTVLDWKTRKARPEAWKIDKYGLLYDSNRAQLAALAAADVWLEAGGLGMMKPEQAAGVVLFPDGSYEVEMLDGGELDRWYDVFAGCLLTWRALKGAGA